MSATTHAAETHTGVVTSWLPVTTAWPSQSGCDQAIYSQVGVGGKAIVYDPFFAENISSNFTCLPPAATTWWHQSDAAVVYSLGPLVCPRAYTTAALNLFSIGSTKVACCPSGYTYQNSMFPIRTLGECNSPLSSGQVFTYQWTTSGTWISTTTTIRVATGSVYAVPVNGFIFAATTSSSSRSSSSSSSSRSSSSSSSSSSTSSSSSSSSSITTSATSTTSNTGLSNSLTTTSSNTDFSTPTNTFSISAASSNGLSTGAAVGVGIGSSLGFIGLIALIWACILVRRKKLHASLHITRQAPGAPPVEMYDPNPVGMEMNGVGSTRVPGLYELKNSNQQGQQVGGGVPGQGYGYGSGYEQVQGHEVGQQGGWAGGETVASPGGMHGRYG